MCLLAAGGLVAVHPLAETMAILVAAVMAVVVARPGAWLVLFAAALPLANLYRWSGWQFPSAFDVLALAIVGVALARHAGGPWNWPLGRFGTAGAVLVALGTSAASLAGLSGAGLDAGVGLPLVYSAAAPVAALRGAGWALAVLALTGFEEDGRQAVERFAAGTALGVLGLGILGGYERLVFTGLFDFGYALRITANFPGMTTGGGQLAAHLAVGLAAGLWLVARGGWRTILGVPASGVAVYLALASYARAAVVALLVVGLVVGVVYAITRLRDGHSGVHISTGFAGLAVAVVAAVLAAYAFGTESALSARFETWRTDLGQRAELWVEGLEVGRKDTVARLVGRGPGAFPASARRDGFAGFRPPIVRMAPTPGDTGDRHLVLGAGEPVYIEQMVEPAGAPTLRFAARLRAPAGAALRVFVCEKAVLYSVACASATLAGGGDGWQTVSQEIATGRLQNNAGWPARPVTLALAMNGRRNMQIAVDDVRLVSPGGESLVQNGDFAEGWAHWFMSSDNHAAWRLENLFVMTYWERGLIGLGVLLLGLLGTAGRQVGQAWRGDPDSAMILGALTGLTAAGMTSALIDVAVMETMLWLLVLMGLRSRRAVQPEA